MEEDIIELIPQVKSKTLSVDFDEQLDAVENLYGHHIHFSFGRHEIERVLEEKSRIIPGKSNPECGRSCCSSEENIKYLFA